eukprot:Seg3321.2 transcript_id=Seg3321.2/GoldUCD/mRNA.D3Y31 product="Transmembrane protein 151B" protein_id=Seg3321.2/GoldUCD/D3Y31
MMALVDFMLLASTAQIAEQPFTFNKHHWARPTILSFVICLQIVVPAYHFLSYSDVITRLRILSLHAFISYVCWLVFYFACSGLQCTKYGEVLHDLTVMCPIMISLSYICMIGECCFAPEFLFLMEEMSKEQEMPVDEKIKKLRETAPRRYLIVECFHYNAKNVQDDHANTTESSNKLPSSLKGRVTSFKEERIFLISHSVDVSEEFCVKKRPIIRLTLNGQVQYGDETTKNILRQNLLELFTENTQRDVYTTVYYRDEIGGLTREEIFTYYDKRSKPFWLNPWLYIVVALFGLSWPYRLLFRLQISKCEYSIKKIIFAGTQAEQEESSLNDNDVREHQNKIEATDMGVVNISFENCQ